MALDGPINGDRFLAYVDQLLTPTLKQGGGGEAALSAALQPRLQPDRKRLRHAQGPVAEGRQTNPRKLWTAIGAFIPAFTPGECASYFAAAGYGAI